MVIELSALEPSGIGTNAILRNFAVLREEFAYPTLVAGPARDGNAWFGERIPIPFFLNLETVSTIPPDGYEPSHAGAPIVATSYQPWFLGGRIYGGSSRSDEGPHSRWH